MKVIKQEKSFIEVEIYTEKYGECKMMIPDDAIICYKDERGVARDTSLKKYLYGWLPCSLIFKKQEAE